MPASRWPSSWRATGMPPRTAPCSSTSTMSRWPPPSTPTPPCATAPPACTRRRRATCCSRAAPMEGRGGVADWDAAQRKLTLWSGTQVPHLARHGLAEVLGLPEHAIRVIAPDVGGGFGVKGVLYPEDVALCLLAMRVGRPVKWVESRH